MKQDLQVFDLIKKEYERQSSGLELIASENYVTDQVLQAMGSICTNKYAEGYPGKRYYGGCVVVDQTLSGAISGLRLSTTPEEIYCALVQAAAFGVRVMIEHAESCGVPVSRMCVCGGIAAKNPLLVQCYADILGRTLEVSTLPNSAAAGAAIGATAAAGVYADLNEAMAALSTDEFIVYEPDMQKHEAYEVLYKRYLKMREAIRR